MVEVLVMKDNITFHDSYEAFVRPVGWRSPLDIYDPRPFLSGAGRWALALLFSGFGCGVAVGAAVMAIEVMR
jgi:hypothetical protein